MAFEMDKNLSTAEKVLVTILIDVSESMGWKLPQSEQSRIDLIAESIETFLANKNSPKYIFNKSIQDIGNLGSTGEIAIGLFSGNSSTSVTWLNLGQSSKKPFYDIDQLENISLVEHLKTGGKTPLVQAVEEAIAVIFKRAKEISKNGTLKRPNLFIITDGKQVPSNDAGMRRVANLIHQYEREKCLLAFGISVFDQDAMDIAKLTAKNATHILGSSTSLVELVKILSYSINASVGAGFAATSEAIHKDIKSRLVQVNKGFLNNLKLNSK